MLDESQTCRAYDDQGATRSEGTANNPFPNYSASIAQEQIDLVQAIYDWSLKSAPAPMPEASIIAGLAVVGGIAGRSYNIAGRGLAGYWWLCAKSGSGKGIIKKVFDKLVETAKPSHPAVIDFKGPGYAASGQAILKLLDQRPYPNIIINADEFAHDVKEMSNPRNINATVKNKVYLEIWSLSGDGDVFDPMVYSDGEKNTRPLKAPNLTLIGTSTTQKANEALSSGLAHSGFLARFNVVEYSGDIAPFNKHHAHNLANPPSSLVSAFGGLVNTALTNSQRGVVTNIAITPEAEEHFTAYAEELRQRRNGISDFASDLLNRNFEKALKIAGTWAVGRNLFFPSVTLPVAQWATGFVDHHSNRLLAKFESGEAGEEDGNQVKQIREVKRVISEYLSDPDLAMRYHPKRPDFQPKQVITFAHIQQRLAGTAAFKNDRMGAHHALTRVMKCLTEDDTMREVPKQQLLQMFNSAPKSYTIGDARNLLDLKH